MRSRFISYVKFLAPACKAHECLSCAIMDRAVVRYLQAEEAAESGECELDYDALLAPYYHTWYAFKAHHGWRAEAAWFWLPAVDLANCDTTPEG